MSRLDEVIVEFLSVSPDARNSADRLSGFKPGAWHRVLGWLDDAGLAFYFLQALKAADANEAVPPVVLRCLEEKFTANQERTADLSRRFSAINRKFEEAGVRYAVLKGFSLVPEFCPDARLRYQGDLDYLVDEQSLSTAQHVLREAGYTQKPSPSREESIFVLPELGAASRGARQYSVRAPHAVELHLDIWDESLDRVASIPRLFSVERAKIQVRNGFAFPALADEDAFLLQVLHTCHHILSHWVRMSSLLEIRYFLNRRASDASLWGRVEQRVGDNSVLREFIVVVSELVTRSFCAPVPPFIQAWSSNIRPGVRLWIERYARRWAFCELPGYQTNLWPINRVARFLHEQYQDRGPGGNTATGDRGTPSRISRMTLSLRKDPSLALSLAWWKRQLPLGNARAQFRYWCEIPHWRRLNRTSARSSAAGAVTEDIPPRPKSAPGLSQF